jgi:hypothetical protein
MLGSIIEVSSLRLGSYVEARDVEEGRYGRESVKL